jgi:predicted MFS family arabinose efflux permease
VRNRPRVSSLLLLAAVNSLFGAPYFSMVPIYARDIFHLGETGLALLMGVAGVGALLGALLVAYLGDFRRKGWFVLGGAILFGLCITGFALSSWLKLSLLFLLGVGFSLVVSVALTNTLLQKLVTDQMRGRVMSMFILSFMGTLPIGNIVAGTASNHFGPPRTLAVGGLIVTTVATIVSIFNKRLRDLH